MLLLSHGLLSLGGYPVGVSVCAFIQLLNSYFWRIMEKHKKHLSYLHPEQRQKWLSIISKTVYLKSIRSCDWFLERLRGVVRGGKKGLKPPFKYYPNVVFSLPLSNENLHFEMNTELVIPCVSSREFYSVTKLLVKRKSKIV